MYVYGNGSPLQGTDPGGTRFNAINEFTFGADGSNCWSLTCGGSGLGDPGNGPDAMWGVVDQVQAQDNGIWGAASDPGVSNETAQTRAEAWEATVVEGFKGPIVLSGVFMTKDGKYLAQVSSDNSPKTTTTAGALIFTYVDNMLHRIAINYAYADFDLHMTSLQPPGFALWRSYAGSVDLYTADGRTIATWDVVGYVFGDLNTGIFHLRGSEPDDDRWY